MQTTTKEPTITPNPTTASATTSTTKTPGVTKPCREMRNNINALGATIIKGYSGIKMSSAEECMEECNKVSICKIWNYYTIAASVNINQCFLKSAAKNDVEESGVITGYCDRSQIIKDLLRGPVHGYAIENAFDDIETIGYNDIYFPKRINMRAGSAIDAIQIDYQSVTKPDLSGPHHGGSGGGLCQLVLGLNERIVKVQGRIKDGVESLIFTTNEGRNNKNCVSNAKVTFVEEYPGYVLSYISGRYGRFLQQIRFNWIREEKAYRVSSVVYDLSKAIITEHSKPGTVFNTTLTNYSPVVQKQFYTFTYSVTESRSFTFSTGLTIGVETTVEAGIPLFAATEMTVSASASLRFKYGSESTEEKSQKYTIEVTLPSNTTMDASLFVLEGTAEVPYVAQITVTYTDDTEKIVKDQEGKYRGVQASNINAVFGPAKPIKTPSTM
ncbi:unnamed protein product [Adineta steineri]|uniref:Jacalin-type lectin domain-containing protein n=2 Tax=Adineta steineri TaxID=433720 RepID=A0A818MIB8_9BILA|nr:unnamed protein product [Adineta steineri]